MRQRHVTKANTDLNSSSSTRDKVPTHVSKDGYVFQVSSRLYPGPNQAKNINGTSYARGTANAPNIPFIASRGMSANKTVLKTSTITLLAPKEMAMPQSGTNYTSANNSKGGKSSMIYNNASSGGMDFLNGNNGYSDGYIYSESSGFTKVARKNRGNSQSIKSSVRSSGTMNVAGTMSIAKQGSFSAIYGGARRGSNVRTRSKHSHATSNASVGYDPRYAQPQSTGPHIGRAWLNNATLDQVSLNPTKSSLNYNFWASDGNDVSQYGNRSNVGNQRVYSDRQ